MTGADLAKLGRFTPFSGGSLVPMVDLNTSWQFNQILSRKSALIELNAQNLHNFLTFSVQVNRSENAHLN